MIRRTPRYTLFPYTTLLRSNMENVSLTGDSISINNATTGLADQYEDYTNLYADLTIGQSYTITVSLGVEASQTQPSAYPSGGKVFIDWNMDGDFLDIGEEVGEIASAPPQIGRAHV